MQTAESTPTMSQVEKVLYTAKTHTTGGRANGSVRSSDGHLEITLSTPGTVDRGTNPEQLFAAGWSACFEGAMGIAARKMRITLPADLAIDAEVTGLISCGLDSMSACRESSVKLRRLWWIPRIRHAPIPRPSAATSTSSSM
jgi:organic hydroperoxide reductase OsmC/OhrA